MFQIYLLIFCSDAACGRMSLSVALDEVSYKTILPKDNGFLKTTSIVFRKRIVMCKLGFTEGRHRRLTFTNGSIDGACATDNSHRHVISKERRRESGSRETNNRVYYPSVTRTQSKER